MTEAETSRLLGRISIEWQNADLPAQALVLWQRYLQGYGYREADDALTEWATSGLSSSAFPPAPGQLVALINERRSAVPDWDEAVAEIERAFRTWRRPAKLPDGSPNYARSEAELYGGPPAEWWSHPVIASFMENAWHEWRMRPYGPGLESAHGTFMAQQRNAYQALAGRVQRDRALAAVGAPRPPRGDLTPIDPSRYLPSPGGTE